MHARLVEARREGLRELLRGWDPDQVPELRTLVDRLAHAFVSDIPTPAGVGR